MNQFNQEELVEFYKRCDYSWIIKNHFRPREMHTPILLFQQLKDKGESELRKYSSGKKLEINLDRDDCKIFATVLLHEALFHYYKAFYNYMAARNLYCGGLLHWINITAYYANFYLARSMTTLSGQQSYRVGASAKYFLENVAKLLNQKKAYRIIIDININEMTGKIIIDNGKVSSHRDVWRYYQQIRNCIDLTPLTFDKEDIAGTSIPIDFITRERNEENYSFEGYSQLDFNLKENNFMRYFERDYIKLNQNILYDDITGGILLALSSLYRFLIRLNVSDLPIEASKHKCMIDYCVTNSEVRDKLINLANDGFNIENFVLGMDEKWYDNFQRHQ